MAETRKISLADIRRQEQYDSLVQLSDRELCETIRAHFETHPALPGEEKLRDQVTSQLNRLGGVLSDNDKAAERQALKEDGFEPATSTPFDNGSLPAPEGNGSLLTPEEKENLAMGYAQTRIRETPLKDSNYYLDFRFFGVDTLKRETIDRTHPTYPDKYGPPIINTVHIDKANAKLQKNPSGGISVMAEKPDGSFRMVGSLHDSFLKNNPMNTDSCPAELEITDFSFCGWESLSAKVIVDTDLMSGDVLMLDDSLLAGIGQENRIEQ